MNIWQTMIHILVFFCAFIRPRLEYFQGVCHHFLVPDTEVTETVQLVFSMELLSITSMSEVRSEDKVCFSQGFLKT